MPFVELQTHGMTNELVCVRLEAKVSVQLPHGHPGEVTALVCGSVGHLVLVDKDKELAKPAFLKESHQRRCEGLLGRSGDLEDLPRLVHVRTGDALKVQVASDLRVEEHLRQVTGRHDELGDEVDVVVTVLAEVGGRLSGLELLKQVGQVQTGTVTAVVAVPVELQHAFALHAEQTRNDTLLHPGTEDDGVVFAIRQGLRPLGEPVKGGLDYFVGQRLFVCLWATVAFVLDDMALFVRR